MITFGLYVDPGPQGYGDASLVTGYCRIGTYTLVAARMGLPRQIICSVHCYKESSAPGAGPLRMFSRQVPA